MLLTHVLSYRPGDTIQAGEEEYTALSAKLSEKLSPTGSKADWVIDPECLGVWYRPNFDNPVVLKINFFSNFSLILFHSIHMYRRMLLIQRKE